MSNSDYKYEKKETAKLEIELKIEVGRERFQKEKSKVFEELSKNVEMSGFRKGKVPKNLVESKLGPKLFEETLNHMLPEITVEILTKENLVPITRVEYQVTKVSDEGAEYTARFALYPDIKLGEFTKIKVKKEVLKIEDKEVNEVVKNMFEDYKKKEEQKVEGESKDTRAASSTKKAVEEKMDDEWAKKLNLGVVDMAGLKELTKKQLEVYKDRANNEKYVSDIIMEAIKLSKIEVPNALVEQELDRRELDYKRRIENLGLKVEDYLRSQNVTMEKLREDWKKDAKNKIEVELLLVEIARTNDLKVAAEEIESEVEKVTEQELKDFYGSESGRNYIRNVMLQQKALNFLVHEVDHHNDPNHKH